MLNTLLKNHPEIGIIGTITSVLFTMVENLEPILKFVALILGVGIGIVTLYIKILEAIKKRREL